MASITGKWRNSIKQEYLIPVLGGMLIAAGWWAGAIAASDFWHFWLMAAAALLAGSKVARLAWGRLLAGQSSIPLLVTLAALGALYLGEAWEAAAVTYLYVLGSFLENITLSRTRTAVQDLARMAPLTARVKKDDAITIVAAGAVAAGETVVVLPGDRVPVDGLVTAGRAELDTAALTGEPLPSEVGPGDQALSGSVLLSGYLELTAEKVGADTTFQRLLRLVITAQAQKPTVQRYLDRFAQWYTPAVIIVALAVLILGRDLHMALTFLVISCPGALVVAAPVAITAGLGNAARHGVLIKGGERLEQIGKVDTVAFDKTGTLTAGKPQVATVVPFAEQEAALLVAAAAGAEQRSEHHLAKAILAYAAQQGVTPAETQEWKLLPGMGVLAHQGEDVILVGNRRLLQAHNVSLSAEQEELIAAQEAAGETVAVVAKNAIPLGLIGIRDVERPDAPALVASLRMAGIKNLVMLTGDHAAAADNVARRLGIDTVRAGLLPAEKVAALQELNAGGKVVAMVGDGVNDAPALAAADVSIAMGASGTQVAVENADIVLMSDNLTKIAYSIALSRRINLVVKQNVAIAVITVALLMAGVLGKAIFLASGMLVHEASILIVIFNGMRLLVAPQKALSR